MLLVGQAENWATPNACERGPELKESKDKRGAGGIDLQTQAASWPSPRAEDSESCGNHPGATDSLTGAMKAFASSAGTPSKLNFSEGTDVPTAKASGWASPAARDEKGANGPAHQSKDRPHEDQLANQAVHLFARRDATTTDDGLGSLLAVWTRPSSPRLSPAFQWWLMRMGHPRSAIATCCGWEETPSIRSLPLSHSFKHGEKHGVQTQMGDWSREGPSTPPGDGEALGSASIAGRDCSSQEREQAGQPACQSGVDGTIGAQSAPLPTATSNIEGLPDVRRGVRSTQVVEGQTRELLTGMRESGGRQEKAASRNDGQGTGTASTRHVVPVDRGPTRNRGCNCVEVRGWCPEIEWTRWWSRMRSSLAGVLALEGA